MKRARLRRSWKAYQKSAPHRRDISYQKWIDTIYIPQTQNEASS